jgi:hypothetical protein
MDRKEVLAKFGALLMTRVRDEAIRRSDSLITGHLKGERAALFQNEMANLSDDDKRELLKLVPEIVDSVLHSFLFLVEDDSSINLSYKPTEEAEAFNLGKLSDGLAGELYSSEGWISLYSHQRRE